MLDDRRLRGHESRYRDGEFPKIEAYFGTLVAGV
jgi:hypothetical protein